MENQIVKIAVESSLEQEKQNYLIEKFNEFQLVTNELKAKAESIIITDENQIKEMEIADEARKAVKKVRVEVDKTRKTLKDSSLRESQTIDKIAKVLTNMLQPIEDELTAKANFRAIKEAERNELIYNNRIAILRQYGESQYDKDMIVKMDEDTFSNFVTGVKYNFVYKERCVLLSDYDEGALPNKEFIMSMNDENFTVHLNNMISEYRRKQYEKEKKIQEESAERERIRVENEILKAELQKKEKELQVEKSKQQEEQKNQQTLIFAPKTDINEIRTIHWSTSIVYDFIKDQYNPLIDEDDFNSKLNIFIKKWGVK